MDNTGSAKNPYTSCLALYAIYAASMLMQAAPQTMTLGTVMSIVGIFMVYRQRRKTAGTVYESHIEWLIRTFWIGGAVYLPIMTVIIATFLYFKLDFTTVESAMQSESMPDSGELQNIFMEKNGDLIFNASACMMIPFGVWWLWRCAKGYKLLKKRLPVSGVKSWL